jgi:hypothetical protein
MCAFRAVAFGGLGRHLQATTAPNPAVFHLERAHRG